MRKLALALAATIAAATLSACGQYASEPIGCHDAYARDYISRQGPGALARFDSAYCE